MILILAQWSATDSQNLQDIHDWMAQLFDMGGLAIGFGMGLVFAGGFAVFRAMRVAAEDAG